MAPLIPRMHVFEIADFSWFPNFLRAHCQAALTVVWTTHVPLLQTSSPAQLVARLLRKHLGRALHSYVFIDFCAGGGGPTPSIERHLNSPADGQPASEPIRFVLTDLHPHAELWAQAAARSPNLSFEPGPVDAARVPRDLLARHARRGEQGGGPRKVFRLFNLAFHHFDDALARRILKDTLDDGGSRGFGIFELQDRGPAGFVSCCLFGIGTLLLAPFYALAWGAPAVLVFTYLLPILPAVLVFDGWMSCLRTRTAGEVEALLRTCGAEGGEEELGRWELRSGCETFMWPVGRLNWVIGLRKDGAEGAPARDG